MLAGTRIGGAVPRRRKTRSGERTCHALGERAMRFRRPIVGREAATDRANFRYAIINSAIAASTIRRPLRPLSFRYRL